MDYVHSNRVGLTVNGAEVRLDGSDEVPLLLAIREQLGLKGARPGCGVGECGSCTVLVDDEPVRSCVTAVTQVAGSHVTTPEGLGGPSDPDPVQSTFLEMQAAQCGYCLNGMIMRVAALARQGATPSRDRLVTELDEHICRCGTHARILQAATRALGGAGTEGEDEFSTCRTVRCGAIPGEDAEDRPPQLERAPRIEDWIGLLDDGRVEVRSGRTEMGQGVHVALGQVAATQLGVETSSVVVRTATTQCGPDEDFTAGSRSMPQGAVAVAMATVAFRRVLLERAAERLRAGSGLEVDPAGAVVDGEGGSVSFAELRAGGEVTGDIEPTDRPVWTGGAMGASPGRADLAEKLTGAPAYVHDRDLPGMLHARAVLPPTYDAELEELDTSGVERMPGIVDVVRDGRLVVVVAEGEHEAVRAATALEARARWRDPGLAFSADVIDTLRALPAEPHVARADEGVDAALGSSRRVRASYTKPYHSHGSMAPSCAVAVSDADGLTVWSATQGVHPLRRELAALLDEDEDRISVIHDYGPGCYGHNGADDAAGLAAVAARAVSGRPVRFQFSSADEFAWETYGSAMAADLDAGLEQGRITAWRDRALTDSHVARPRGQGDRLAVSWLRAHGPERPWPGPNHGGARNLVPIYDVGAVDAVADHVRGPLRTGSLRSLGSFFNIFAIESFMDELAEAAGADPLEFRLAHLSDPRGREVLEAVADAAGWEPRVGPSGVGRGLALCRYHDVMAYVAMVADVSVDLETNHLGVTRIVMAADAGSVVNAEGLRQQLEGGVLQGLSRTLHEELVVDHRGVRSRDWSDYPVVRFADTPSMDLVVLDRAGSPPLGAGESSTPPVPAAVANAIDDATGIRMRDLPLTPRAVERRLLGMTEAEMERVLTA